ncbi:restriction endonuclease [Coprothermobacteraceae bacterium]|nr:restriction endonuclease [Coprothermobacteraceae bacterium]
MDFISVFCAKMEEHKPKFEIRGLLTRDDRVYPLSTDTKVLSTVFELLVRPFILEIADEHGFIVYEPDQQNYYPDFTLMKSESDKAKIAIDIKTTYRDFRKDGTWRARFTLGSFASFMRNKTKNIAFPYSDYAKHYIVGFIYTRVESTNGTHPYSLENREEVPYPFKDVEWFVQEKYKIASDTPGSGNTENIGSITAASVAEFAKGDGPFANLGEDVFNDYWMHFPRYRERKQAPYTNLKEYLAWKGKSW